MKAALLKEEEDQLLPHKRKRKSKDVENGDDHHCDVEPEQKRSKTELSADKVKKRHTQPPPLNFQELLKIAEKKQHEPIIIEKKEESSLPMMTKKEREKYLEEKRMEASRNARRQGKFVPSIEKPKEVKSVERTQKSIVSSSKVDVFAEDKLKKNASVWSKDLKISKEPGRYSKNEKYTPRSLNGSDSVEVKLNNGISNRNVPKIGSEKYSCSEKKYNSKDEQNLPKPKSISDKYIPRNKSSTEDEHLPKPRTLLNNDRHMPKSSSSSSEKYSPKPKNTPSDKHPSKSMSTEKYVPKFKTSSEDKYSQKSKIGAQPERYVPKGKCLSSTDQYTASTIKRSDEKYSPRPISSESLKSKPTGSKDKYVPTPVNKSNKLPPNNNRAKDSTPKQFPPRDMVPKQFPPRDMIPKKFPPRDLVPKQFPPSDMKRRNDRHMPMRNKRQVIESDSEYDSELDDFIDDGPEDEADYSKVISEIFRYDKSKYKLFIFIDF